MSAPAAIARSTTSPRSCLTAAVMDVIGGVAKAELLEGQASVVAGLPGVLGIADDGWMALGTAEFLRAWSGTAPSGWSNSPRRTRGNWNGTHGSPGIRMPGLPCSRS
ncbi:DUF6368 family protein [Streptomyces sp. NPDC055722]